MAGGVRKLTPDEPEALASQDFSDMNRHLERDAPNPESQWVPRAASRVAILPTEHVRASGSLLGVGAEILVTLPRPLTVSKLWDRIRLRRAGFPSAPITYAQFVLALDFLYMIGALDLRDGELRRTES